MYHDLMKPFYEYFKVSTVHGFKYLSDERLKKTERYDEVSQYLKSDQCIFYFNKTLKYQIVLGYSVARFDGWIFPYDR